MAKWQTTFPASLNGKAWNDVEHVACAVQLAHDGNRVWLVDDDEPANATVRLVPVWDAPADKARER